MKIKKLDTNGNLHWVVMIISVVMFAFVGVRVYQASHAITGPPPPGGGRPTGLVQAGNSKTTCITDGPASSSHPAQMAITYLSAVNVTYSCASTYTNTPTNWSQWENPWILSSTGAPFSNWVDASTPTRTVIVAQDLIPHSEIGTNWLAQCDAGAFNSYATNFATNMVYAGLQYSVIRLDIEMNGTWEAGSLGTTQAQWTQWDQCWDQEVTAMRNVNPYFLFDWNVNANYRDFNLASFYPGNAYVDIIGIDFYDQSGVVLPPVGNASRWATLASEPDGLNAVAAFAASHGKPLSIPEWGTVSTQGDDGNYVTNISNFVKSHDVAYQTYFNAGVDTILPLDSSKAPNTVAAYAAAFGAPAGAGGHVITGCTPFNNPTSSSLTPGQALLTNQALISPNGLYELNMQSDGNLVLYGCNATTGAWKAYWSTGTGGDGPSFVDMQGDGNLVVYKNTGGYTWDSGTYAGYGPATLDIQTDSNLVIYLNSTNKAIWDYESGILH
jgi:hypothetical protein